MASSSYHVAEDCVFKTERALCVNCTDKTPLIDLPLESWDKRCDISLPVNATLPTGHFLKQRSIGHPPCRSANVSWCAEKINKNRKTKPSAAGGVWLLSWLVWSFEESISVSEQSRLSSGTTDPETGSNSRGAFADPEFGYQGVFSGRNNFTFLLEITCLSKRHILNED